MGGETVARVGGVGGETVVRVDGVDGETVDRQFAAELSAEEPDIQLPGLVV